MYNMGVSASETHSMKNTGISTTEAIEKNYCNAKIVIASETSAGLIQSAFGCGFEGKIPMKKLSQTFKIY
jgi:hypothetical protein